MKALTLWPEWAFAIAHLGKDVENRTWTPPKALIGQRIAIHAGAYIGGRRARVAVEEGAQALRDMARRAGVDISVVLPILACTWTSSTRILQNEPWRSTPIVTRAIVATAVLAEVRRDSPSPWAVSGAVHWCLADVQVLSDPEPCSGRQGLWDAPELPTELHCPLCGAPVKWSCNYESGRADCQDGRKVSQRWPGAGDPCPWPGARIVRLGPCSIGWAPGEPAASVGRMEAPCPR